ncbi:MAG: hypothetical protein L0Z50_17975, partial [Verrucomicrobiales bacterium]|nr:hypothetical protein [Verrucomicrobiales bacterium]
LGGATPHEAAEVRVPSIRGQLRWWARALGLGRAIELRFFGSVAGESGKASSVALRITRLAIPPAGQAVSPLHQFATVEASTLGVQDINSGAGYLTFPLRPQRNGQPHRRGRIPPKTAFNLEVVALRLDAAEFTQLCALVRVFVTFGSLGNRSRRVFGAMSLVGEQDASDREIPPQRPADLSNYPNRTIEWKLLPERATDAAGMRERAGKWLKPRRKHLGSPLKFQAFGHARDLPGEPRRASPIILRPVVVATGLQLGLVFPKSLPPAIAAVL